MNNPKHYLKLFFAFLLMAAVSCTNKNGSDTKASLDPKVAKLKLPEGFHADHLYSPGLNDQGSWVAMTFDDKGRMIASDQYGNLYRLTIPPIGADTATNKIKVEPLIVKKIGDTAKIKMGFAHGLLFAFNSLYVMVNDEGDTAKSQHSGLYRLEDTNGDDQFDKVTLLKSLNGNGEHGPHSIVLSPDKKSIYVIAGNMTQIPKMDVYKAPPPAWYIDNLMPLIRDPNGHDNGVDAHGGWIAHLQPDGTHWELIANGFRNPFDLCFNDAGDMFTWDSDMEWDFGLPWYRPIRICQVSSGAEFGWRPGTDKWSPSFPDNLPPTLNIGQGSPTSFFNGHNAHFPEKYRKSLFAFDWSFGIIYAIQPEADGASYKTKGEEFVSGSPLPLTDGQIGPDGALYFLTGGRRLESDLYRVYYGDNSGNTESLAAVELNESQKTRRKLEEYQGEPKAGAIDFAWPYLKSEDRFIRFAARIAVENQPVSEWKEKALNEKDPVTLTQAMLALARQGKPDMRDKALLALTAVDFAKLSASQQIDLTRAFELLIARLGMPGKEAKEKVAAYLNPYFPASSNELNRELVKVLVYIDAPQSVEKTMALLNTAKDDSTTNQNALTNSSDLIMRNPQYGMDIAGMLSKVPPQQQTFYAVVLSQAKNGWTPELREKYFKWFYTAFGYKGGHSFVGFIDLARKNALKNVPKDKFAYYNTISGDSIVSISGTDLTKTSQQPKGPGRDWEIDSAMKYVDSGMVNRDFENGKAMFAASLCISCHTMRGEGGVAGPDLTQLGTRFSYHDMLESIIDPSKTISDQFGSTVFNLKAGGSIVGRIISQDGDKYVISQNPFAPRVTRDVLKKDVASTRISEISPMLPGLINRLNPEELKNLLAYLKAGGDPNNEIFKKK
ncbi:MAG: c-type cytochrome [Bacteroidetes bacterium]|nr:c-type cytochrome [Bacteroidota bacterium]